MLVRAHSIILWNPFLSQSINLSENEQDFLAVSSHHEESLSNEIVDIVTPIVTTDNKGKQHIVSSVSSPSIVGAGSTAVVDDKEDKGKKDDVLVVADLSNNSAINTTNDDNLTLNQTTSSSIISFATVSSLLDKPIPTYLKATTAPTVSSTATAKGDETSTANNEVGGDGLIYYKRREDFYPQFTHKSGEENDTVSSFTNTQQSRRQTIHNVLGKATTKIHPGEGMPIFKQSSSDNLNSLKPKMVFRRIKTMVVKNKKRLATL
ncbi:unnamed protein product [Mucor hiemalis]